MRSLLLVLLVAVFAGLASAQTERTVSLRGGPKVQITVPPGYSFESATNRDGSVQVAMENPVWPISILVLIGAESAKVSASPEWQRNRLITFLSSALPNAREADYNIEPLATTSGSGLLCHFTALDADRGGQPEPGHFLYCTGGLKAQSECVVLFEILSNDRKSPEYREALDVFVSGFNER